MTLPLALFDTGNENLVSAIPTDPAPVPGLRDSSFEKNKQSSVHRWVPWIAGFSAGVVADTFQQYLPAPDRRDLTILEPFSGVGTTLVDGFGNHDPGVRRKDQYCSDRDVVHPGRVWAVKLGDSPKNADQILSAVIAPPSQSQLEQLAAESLEAEVADGGA